MLGNEHRLEAAVAIARQLHPHRAALGQQRLGTDAIALVGLFCGLALAGAVTQMHVHLGALGSQARPSLLWWSAAHQRIMARTVHHIGVKWCKHDLRVVGHACNKTHFKLKTRA